MIEQEVPSGESRFWSSVLVHGGALTVEVVAFWHRHPDCRFAESTMCYGLGCRRLDLERAMKAMVEAGLVDVRVHDGMPFYSLTRDEGLRRQVMGLSVAR